MQNRPALSAILQEIALQGIKEEKRVPPRFGDWFHLQLFFAWHAWNVAVKGKSALPRALMKDVRKIKTNLGITEHDVEAYFISSDPHQIIELMAAYKKEMYPFDRREIVGLESTPQGNLRVYSR